MKISGIAVIAGLALALAGCGGGNSSSSNNINGSWRAALTNTDNTPAFAFTTAFNQSSGSNVSVTSLSFTTSSPCFASGSKETGSFGLTGDFNGNVTGAFGMTIQSGSPSGNTLMLQGAVKNNVITGTWTLTGVTAGCTGTGIFTFNRM